MIIIRHKPNKTQNYNNLLRRGKQLVYMTTKK